MARSNLDRFDNIFQLLCCYKLTMNDDIPNEYKCVICHNILINACQASCGCDFCQHCIDEAVQKGDKFCPGDTDECKLSNLSVALRDYRMNKQISKLTVKCPLESCSHKCQLIDLYFHLESCQNRSLKCPFQPIGCTDEGLNGKIELEKHLSVEIETHCKILVRSMENLQMRINHLETELTNKQEIINEMKAEMHFIKNDRQELLDEMAILKPSVENKINEISAELNSRGRDDQFDQILNEIDLIKTNGQKVKSEIDGIKKDFHEKFKSEVTAQLKGLCTEIEGKSEMKILKLTELQKLSQLDLERRMNEVEKNLNLIDGIFMWKINKIDEIKKCGYIWSDYFYMNVCTYRMRMRLDAYGDYLWIRFCIYCSPNDHDLDWPFQAEITLKIFSKLWPDSGKSITKNCTIDKPSFGSCECSEEFSFSYSDFIIKRLTQNDIFFVECHVKN